MIAEILCGVTAYDEKELNDPKNYLYAHRDMIKELMQVELPKKDMESAMQVVTEKVNDICKNILFNTSVYKKDEQGYKGFTRFLKACALEQKKQ